MGKQRNTQKDKAGERERGEANPLSRRIGHKGNWQEKSHSFDFSEMKNEGRIFNEHNSTVGNAVELLYASSQFDPASD